MRKKQKISIATHLKTEKRQQFLKRVVANVIANQPFEGSELSSEMMQDLERIATGTLSTQEALVNLRNRSHK
jgi:hypothetical protein